MKFNPAAVKAIATSFKELRKHGYLVTEADAMLFYLYSLGFVVMPIDPTPEMKEAMVYARKEWSCTYDAAVEAYHNMREPNNG